MNNPFVQSNAGIPDICREFEGYGTYRILNRGLQGDGRGGTAYAWTPGPTFDAAVVLNSSNEAKVAFAQGVTGIYRVAISRSVLLPYLTVFRSEATGATYRVTSRDETSTPKDTALDLRWVDAEDYTLPAGEGVISNG